jgi:gliding motility-associated-like protein
LCPDDKITFDPDVTGGKGSVSSFWIVAGDSLYQNTLEVGQGGTYEFVSIDSLGCKDQQAIDVTVYTEMSPDVSLADVNCPGDHDGEILLNDILGGNGPYFISLNGGNSQPIGAFPYSIPNLAAGNYTIVLTDAFSCIYTFQVTIGSASAETLSLGPDQTILVGDSAVIKPTLSFVPDSFYWTGDIDLLDLTQLNNTIHPDHDQTITLFGIDAKGCLYSDDVFIRVLLKSSVYVPTIFSPNDDGINDILGPHGDPSVVSFDYFEVFSRWGELVYSEHQFLPLDNKGWDGTFNGKPMQPGVFIYRYSATNKKGKTITGYGDVTIVR